MNTYYINEEHLGDVATEAEAHRMVELLNERGYDVEYGTRFNRDEDAEPSDKDWNECLDIIAKESATK